LPGAGAFVLLALLAGAVVLVYRYDRTGGTLTLFAVLVCIVLLMLALLLAGLLVFASFSRG